MGGLYSNQKVYKRRYLPHINTERLGASAAGFFSFVGEKLLQAAKFILSILAVFFIFAGKKLLSGLMILGGILGAFLFAVGSRCFRIIQKYLSILWEIIRYNPIFRKTALITCLSSMAAGAIFLVFFAVLSPELPSENLFSTMNDISGLNNNDEWHKLTLFSSDDDWVVMTTVNISDFETGAGSQIQDRSKDIEYPVRPGETLSEIAYAYGIPYNFLAWYNKINNANRIRVGTIITIPSLENIKLHEPLYEQQKANQRPVAASTRSVRSIEITHESRSSGTGSGTTVHFSIVNPPANLKSYEWDLGDGRRSFRESPSYEYSQPKTYVARLTAQDASGNIYRSANHYIDIPHPASTAEHSTTKFVTLSSPDDYFVVNGTITKVSRYSNINDVMDLSESDHFLTKARFKRAGFYGVTVQETGGREQYYSIFVSPVPTVHVDNSINSFNWYRTQFNTGTPSNCGPASAAMGVSWATGRYYPVSAARQTIGWVGDGGTSFDDLLGVIKGQNVTASMQSLRTVQDIMDVIDSGAIAIILFHTDGVRTTSGNPAEDHFGKYYNDSTGHYIVVKGYSMNGEYVVVHDPIPSDWGANSFRYADEISMMGRNRYFQASELLRSLRRGEMIVVPCVQ